MIFTPAPRSLLFPPRSGGKVCALLTALLLFVVSLSCSSKEPPTGILYDFENESDLDRLVWRCRARFSLSREHATSRERSLKCEFGRLHYPGVAFNDFPTDLTGARSLSIDFFNDASFPLELVVRIDDIDSGEEYDNRYNGSFTLRPGKNRVVIALSDVRTGPANRRLDLSRISRFLLFLHRPPGPFTLYVDRIDLK